MNIAFFGSSLVSAYWNGAATYYRGLIRALHDLGYDVTFYEPDAYGRQQHRDLLVDPDQPQPGQHPDAAGAMSKSRSHRCHNFSLELNSLQVK